MWISIFRNGLLVGRIFEILNKIFFGFPIVHQHVNLTIITCWRNEIFFEHFFKMLMVFLDTWHQSTFQNQIVSYMSVNFAKKNHFFGTRFFTFHQHVIHFLCKKRAKKRLLIVIFIKKNFRKNEKNKKNFSNFPNMWHKKSTFSRNFYIYVWSWEKWYNILKNFISDVL